MVILEDHVAVMLHPARRQCVLEPALVPDRYSHPLPKLAGLS